MNARYQIAAVLFVLLGLALSAFVAPAAAATPAGTAQPFLVAPGEPYGLPKFGFSSSTIYGYGERIVFVRPGSRASFLGLEPGDVLLSLNGQPLTYSGSWTDALSSALNDGGYLRIKIRDVRTGHIFFRETFVNWGGGPVEHYYKSHSHVTPKVLTNVTPKMHFEAKPILPKIKFVK